MHRSCVRKRPLVHHQVTLPPTPQVFLFSFFLPPSDAAAATDVFAFTKLIDVKAKTDSWVVITLTPQNGRNHRRKTGKCRPHATIPQTRIINSTLGRCGKCIIEQVGRGRGRSCDAWNKSAQKLVWKPRKGEEVAEKRRDGGTSCLLSAWGKCLSGSRYDLFLTPSSHFVFSFQLKGWKKKKTIVWQHYTLKGVVTLSTLGTKSCNMQVHKKQKLWGSKRKNKFVFPSRAAPKLVSWQRCVLIATR